jgi:alpha-1,4-N-acetylglucosaminyltransferase EXTL3
MLTKSMILATEYLYKYTCEMPSSIREYVDRELNCEDIAMNFLVANTSNRGPLLVKGKLRDYGDTRNSVHSDTNQVSTSALSAKRQHRKRRGTCITDFHRLWGAMPLRYSYGMAVNAVQEQAFCEKHGVLVLCNDQSEP